MARKSEIVKGGLRPLGKDDEMIIDIRPDGIVSTPWLNCEGNAILNSIGRVPKEFERISNYCG